MAFYSDEEELWKCPKHPSKRRHTCGICPVCLTDRLSALCPDCAHARPCACSATSSSSSPASSHFSSDAPPWSGGGTRVSALLAAEPAFRRSKSLATAVAPESRSGPSIWSFFKTQKSKREKIDNYNGNVIMVRSRSVCAPIVGPGNATSSSPSKGKGWYFPSPLKAFRQNKSSKVVQERSPLHRG